MARVEPSIHLWYVQGTHVCAITHASTQYRTVVERKLRRRPSMGAWEGYVGRVACECKAYMSVHTNTACTYSMYTHASARLCRVP